MGQELTRSEPEEGGISWRRALAAVFALASALGLVVLVALVAVSNRQRDEALAAQQHSFQVVILARTLESTMTRAEAALGRYVISADKQTGRYYYDQWRSAGFQIDRLQDVTSDNPRQTALIGRLRGIYKQRGEELAATALRTNYGQNWNALSKFYQAGRARSVEEMTRTLQAIIDTEDQVLQKRTGAATLSIERSNWLAGALSIFGGLIVLGAVGLAFKVVHEIAQRRLAHQDAEEVARLAEELEEAVAERTAELRTEAAEREAAEAQLRQIQKMEAVGQLTGGIAHDFNNMLAVVLGGLELAKRRIGHPDELARHLDNAMEGTNRAAALTRRLLAFARAEPLLPEAVSPDALIRGMTELLDRTLGERIAVRTEFASAGWNIWVDRHQLENTLLNLAVNARDAMDGEGTLTLATGTRLLGDGEVGALPTGEYVTIGVTDSGCGMTRDVLERVFEPFFTTKPPGKGTGLGLSQIFGFVRQSRGEIDIVSAPGEGTTVTLLLPRCHEAQAAAPEPVASAPEMTPAHAGAQILVVEDDPRVLVATIDALTELGHYPIPCPSPVEAERLMAAHPGVALIISDVVMPGTTGPELIAALRPLYPHAGVLFVTGFAGDVGQAAAFAGHDLLRKPFTIGALAAAVDAALRRASEPPLYGAAAAAE